MTTKQDNEATGYSDHYSLEEALRNAIKALPQIPSYPNSLTRIKVVEIGVEIGGIAGFNRMLVRVGREMKTSKS
jgi:hypothetical protein